MTRQINLTRTPQKLPNQGYKQTIVASGGVSMVNEIFVIQVDTLNPLTNTTINRFLKVANPTELVNLPIGAPLQGEHLYRVDSLNNQQDTVSLKSVQFWTDLQEAVNALIQALNAADESQAPETVTLSG